MFKYMDEASSTRNMDVCVVEENEIINTSQKVITSALVTITQKKLKVKKSRSKWVVFVARVSSPKPHQQTKEITPRDNRNNERAHKNSNRL